MRLQDISVFEIRLDFSLFQFLARVLNFLFAILPMLKITHMPKNKKR